MTLRHFLISLLGIALVYTLFLMYSPTKVYKEVDGLIFSFESKFEKKTRIILSGKRDNNLFTRDQFTGLLEVDGHSYNINLYYEGGKFFATIVEESEQARLTSIGSVMATKNFDYIWVMLKDINERYDLKEGYVFSPADNMEEANELIKEKLMKVTQ